MRRTPIVYAALICICTAGAVLPAQVYVPSNTPATGTCNAAHTGKSESRYQEIIDATYLPQAPFKVLDVSFAPCASVNPVYSQYQVRMTHTTLVNFAGNQNFDNNLGRCPAVLHSGPLSWTATANTWSPLGCTGNAFGYDGQGRNILVEFRHIQSSGSTTSHHRDGVSPRLYTSDAGAYSSTTGVTVSIAGAKLELIIDRTCVLYAPDTAQIGQSHAITADAMPAGENCQIAASLGASTAINLGPCSVWLVPDGVFVYSATVGAPIFNGYQAITPASGKVIGKFSPPNIPALVGVCVYHAAVSVGSSGVSCCTNTAGTLLTP